MKRMIVLALFVTGCVIARPPGITDADERMVTDCLFIGPVEGFAEGAVYGLKSDARVSDARALAVRAALKRGATHVVWQTVGPFGQHVTGAAYRCTAK